MSLAPQIDYDNAPAANRAAFDDEVRLRGSVTNMKRTLLHSVPAYRAFMEWYPLRDEVLPIIGERGFVIFCHAISAQNECLICSTYFRKALSDLGLSPDSFEPTADEALLIDFGRAIANHHNGPLPPALKTKLATRFSAADIVKLVAFAGLMVATNLFNSVVEVELDAHLHGYRKI